MTIIYNTDSEFLREPNLLIPKKKPIREVSIDWRNTITRGLIGCYPLINGTGHDLVQELNFRYSGIVVPDKDSRYCPDSPGTINSGLYCNDNNLFTPSAGLTAFVIAKASSYPPDSCGLFNQWGGGTGVANQRSWLLFMNSSGYIGAYASTNGTTNTNYNALGSVAVGTNTLFSAAFTWGAGDYVRAYRNGSVDDTSSTTMPSLHNAAGVQAYIGGPLYHLMSTATSNTFLFEGNIYFAALWGRQLSADEIKTLHNNPYQFLIPA